jgi:hypothetical protein
MRPIVECIFSVEIHPKAARLQSIAFILAVCNP